MPATVPDSEHVRGEPARLRQLVWFDLATVCTAVAVMSATFALVERSGWLIVLCVLVSCSGVVMAGGLVPLGRGDLAGAVAWVAVANGVVAPAATLIATFAWPLMMLAALLPAVLAAPYVSGPRLARYVVLSLVVSIAVVVLGLYQDVSGFEAELPSWLPPVILLVFTPFLAGMVVVTALQHSTRLRSALAETLDANRAIRDSRARVVAATDHERRRVERDLHDGAQQRLVAMGLRARAAEQLCRTEPARAVDAIAALRDDIHAAHRELRDLAHGIYPPVLTQHGLSDALSAAADRCPLPVELELEDVGRFDADREAAVYFCCVEALQNAGKHAGAGARVRLTLRATDDSLEFRVADDGRGFDTERAPRGVGLDNLRDRLGAAGGALAVRSAVGAGTTVTGRLPAR